MKSSLVSIVVPVYNTGEKAVKVINHLLSGSYNNIEVLVIDDGSTDDSLKLLRSVESKKVRIFSKKNGGPSSARNFGIDKARGDYLMFIDSDDDVKKDFVDKLVEEMKEPDTSIVVSGVCYKDLYKKTTKDVYLNDFSYLEDDDLESFMLRSLIADGRMYPAFNKIFDTRIIRDNGIRFDEKMSFGEDTKFVLDYLRKGEGRIKFVLKPLYIYNYGTETSTAKKAEGKWSNWKKCYINLKQWVKHKTVRKRILLGVVYTKWRISWLRSR